MTPLENETEFDALVGGFSAQFGVQEITARELIRRQARGENLRLLDIRTPQEQSVSRIPGALPLQPDTDLAIYLARRSPEKTAPELTIAYCTGGYRSARSIARAREQAKDAGGLERLVNLRGGAIAYANQGGEFVEPVRHEPTRKIHGYNAQWAAFIQAPYQAVLKPSLPPK